MPNWYGIEGIKFEWLGTVSTILGAACVFVDLGMLMGW